MIQVHSKSVQVVEAVSLVYKEYETFLTSKSILIHHVFEKNEDLCKKIGIQKLKALNNTIMSLSELVPLKNLKEMVDGALNITLSEGKFRLLCSNVFFLHVRIDIGTTHGHSNPRSNISVLNKLKEEVINQTLEEISKSFVDEMCTGISTSINSKVKTNLKTGLMELKVNISPELFATPIFDGTYMDVDSVSWRTEVIGQIYEKVCKNRALIEEGFFSNIKTMCTRTKRDLQEVSMQINDLEKTIGFPDQETRMCRFLHLEI